MKISRNKRLFGVYTVLLCLPYFIVALRQVAMFFISEKFRNFGINALVFPLAFLLVGIGSIKAYAGYALLKNVLKKEQFKSIFILISFFEISLGFIYGLTLIERLGFMGNIIVMSFIIYYVYAFIFFKYQTWEI